MKQPFVTLLLLFVTFATSHAQTQPEVIFSQDVAAIDAEGNLLPSVKIEPDNMPGVKTHDFDLGRKRLLRIESNIDNIQERGLAEVAATIRRCYAYVENTTGQSINGGVLLYLIELEKVPYAYNFKASYNDASLWGEVRLALIHKDAPLIGSNAPSILTDLLYDALPHELGHNVLGNISNLQHDIDGNVSNHTRWFIEGVCEVIAKGFSLREKPALHNRFLSLRNIDVVLANTVNHTAMLEWAQNNSNSMSLESDLYGASMLTLMEWTKIIQLRELLTYLDREDKRLKGDDLVALMVETTGVGPEDLLQQAHSHGLTLNEKIILAKNEL